MRFYRVHYYTDREGSQGFAWFTAKAAAKREAREMHDEGDEVPEIEAVDITPTKRGILRALRVYASHSDNG